MGIVSDIFGGGSSSPPPAPNYTQAAQATAAGNMIGQNTPYGSLNYSQSGTDAYGNPMYTANQNVSPNLQNAVFNTQNQVTNATSQPFTGGNLPSYGINPNQSYSDAIMSRLQPQQQMEQKQFDAQMANQGIPVGSEAYQNADRQFQQGQNDQRTSAVVGGMGVGLQANNQQYNQNYSNYLSPFTTANLVKGIANPSYVQTPAGPNYLGAVTSQGQYNQGIYNAQQANQTNQMNGLLSLGGTLGAAALMAPVA